MVIVVVPSPFISIWTQHWMCKSNNERCCWRRYAAVHERISATSTKKEHVKLLKARTQWQDQEACETITLFYSINLRQSFTVAIVRAWKQSWLTLWIIWLDFGQ
ncbi:hypothetical protein K492DRAFT_212059 [Lichtheimia hyalospora FSU 10163]|nr:hypothetical protein K492DRAFT_212059 [Lichtheimia hyalospora FSU 10163]